MENAAHGPVTEANRVTVPSYMIFFFGALAALGPLSMDAYLPAIPAMAASFGVSIVSLNNTLSVFLVGYACGQFFGGSLSDQIGRKRIGYTGLSVYVVATLAIAFARDVDQMLALRFFQAVGGGFSTVIGMATVRDIYPIDQLGRRFATVTAVVLVAPLVAPMVGTLLLTFGWEAIFVLKALYAVLLFGAYAVIVPETRPGAAIELSLRSMFKQCYSVVTRRVAEQRLPIRYATAMAFSASVMMIFVTNVSFIYMEYFGVPATRFPLLFGVSVLAFMPMNFFSMRKLNIHNAGRFFRIGLTIQLTAVTTLLVVVLTGHASLATTVPLIVAAVSTLGLVGPSGSARYMGFFHQLAGSASSVYTTMMFMLGGLLGAVPGLLYNGSLVPVIGTMLLASLTANAIGWRLPVGPVLVER
jgi:MFS transporter, DHA1 family, multidrug resistance protein